MQLCRTIFWSEKLSSLPSSFARINQASSRVSNSPIEVSQALAASFFAGASAILPTMCSSFRSIDSQWCNCMLFVLQLMPALECQSNNLFLIAANYETARALPSASMGFICTRCICSAINQDADADRGSLAFMQAQRMPRTCFDGFVSLRWRSKDQNFINFRSQPDAWNFS